MEEWEALGFKGEKNPNNGEWGIFGELIEMEDEGFK